MPRKPHLKLDTNKQQEEPVALKFNYGFGETEKEDDPNYRPMASAFRNMLGQLQTAIQLRTQERTATVDVPDHIFYINILFQSQFDVSKFFQVYFRDFGLLAIRFSKFNHEVLFAIENRELFADFLTNIEKFISNVSGRSTEDYSRTILFIKEFRLLSTPDILKFEMNGRLMNVLLANFPLHDQRVSQIQNALVRYLQNKNISYTYNPLSRQIEVADATEEQIMEIAKNFDIILSVTSSLATVIKPGEFNLPQRSYGFDIENAAEDLPIIGIVDTGISKQTPLASLILADNSFNITGTDSLEDNADAGRGHGTAVAALAALGRNAYYKNYRGGLHADAKLLSIKILDSHSGFLSESAVLDLLKRTKVKYPAIKIFVLTTCYSKNKNDNEDHSTYAYELDKFAFDNDCLIVIATGNNHDASNGNTGYDLNYFFAEETNLCSPAESMNNLVVGAAAGLPASILFEGIALSQEFPALYSRKGHVTLETFFDERKFNKTYFRPDVIECGGDYEQFAGFIGTGNHACMELLSANPAESFYPSVGTSFAAPLVANVAAQIQKIYPGISASSIKALIINGASTEIIRFQSPFESLVSKTAGHGIINPEKSVFSNQNRITFLIEEEIKPEEVRLFPLNFPEYLTLMDLRKKRGVLKITATLCFQFKPILHHQLAYCPLHISFGFFKNQNGEEIMAAETGEDGIKSKLKTNMGWSQNGRHIQKPIPYSNTQKISFVVNTSELFSEHNTFKIAVNCRINPQLLAGTERTYQGSHAFSIAVMIEEKLRTPSTRLYDEMEIENETEVIATGDLSAEGIAEV